MAAAGDWCKRVPQNINARARVKPVERLGMDPSIALVGCVAGVVLIYRCLTF